MSALPPNWQLGAPGDALSAASPPHLQPALAADALTALPDALTAGEAPLDGLASEALLPAAGVSHPDGAGPTLHLSPPPLHAPAQPLRWRGIVTLGVLVCVGLAGWSLHRAGAVLPSPSVVPPPAPVVPALAAMPAPDPYAVSALLATPAARMVADKPAPVQPVASPAPSLPRWNIRRDADLPAPAAPRSDPVDPLDGLALTKMPLGPALPGDADDADLPAGWPDWQQASRAAAQGDWASALQGYQRAYAALPSQPERAFNLAVSLEQLGQRNTARQWYQHALSLTDAHSDPALLAQLHARLAVPEPRP